MRRDEMALRRIRFGRLMNDECFFWETFLCELMNRSTVAHVDSREDYLPFYLLFNVSFC
jgi:hypothetical protein